MSIYKSCDIRGVYGTDLNDTIAFRLGRTVGERFHGQAVVVAGDLRVSTPALKAALIDGLQRSGVQVVDLGLISTPAFYYAKRQMGAPCGVMVTASHNPAPYNGFKLMFGDLPITPEELQILAQQIEANRFGPETAGSYRQADILGDYMNFLSRSFPDLKPHHLVVDAGNGSMWSLAPTVLRRVGQAVDELYCSPDGTFPNRNPNPAIPKHLKNLCQRVLDAKAEVGVAYDGDGDRVIFVDEAGHVQPADRTLVLFIRYLLRHHPGATVVYDLKSSSIVADEILALGGRPIMEKSGHAFIKRRLLLEDALLGGEISGHYFFRELGGDDALYATLVLLRALDDLGVSFAQAMQTVPVYPITPDIRLACPAEQAQQILDELCRVFSDYPINMLDGVRIQFPEGWALVRISVTEPLITLRFEAHTEAALDQIQREVRARSPLLDALMRGAGL